MVPDEILALSIEFEASNPAPTDWSSPSAWMIDFRASCGLAGTVSFNNFRFRGRGPTLFYFCSPCCREALWIVGKTSEATVICDGCREVLAPLGNALQRRLFWRIHDRGSEAEDFYGASAIFTASEDRDPLEQILIEPLWQKRIQEFCDALRCSTVPSYISGEDLFYNFKRSRDALAQHYSGSIWTPVEPHPYELRQPCEDLYANN